MLEIRNIWEIKRGCASCIVLFWARQFLRRLLRFRLLWLYLGLWLCLCLCLCLVHRRPPPPPAPAYRQVPIYNHTPFDGKPAYFLCRDGTNRNFYDLTYKPLKLESVAELEHIDLAPMIQIANELSAPFPFVRIDLYNCKDGVYFGEYTFNCREGKQEFPMELELYFGSLW